MGLFDWISIEYNCPRCKRKTDIYQTHDLIGQMASFRLGEPINLGDGRKNFKFDIYGYCSKCDTGIECVGIVSDYVFQEVREKMYYPSKESRKFTASNRIIASLENKVAKKVVR